MDFDRIMTLKISDITDSNSPLIDENLVKKYIQFSKQTAKLTEFQSDKPLNEIYTQNISLVISITLIALTFISKNLLSARRRKEQTSN